METADPVCQNDSVEGGFICPGIVDDSLQKHADLPPRIPDAVSSVIPYYLHVTYRKAENGTTLCSTTVRSQECSGTMSSDGEACRLCLYAKRLILNKVARQEAEKEQKLGKQAPLSKVSKERLQTAFTVEREESQRKTKELEEIRIKLNSEDCVEVSEKTHLQFMSILGQSTMEEKSLIKLFWEEQVKAFGRKNGGMRWHPMMVRFAILLHSQSPSAYRCLREVGVLKLPGESTLRDYTNVVHPEAGFQIAVFDELRRQTESLPEHQRWVCLLHDEIAIKSGLVFD